MKRLRKLLGDIWSAPRPLELTFAGLVLAAVFVYVPVRLTFGVAGAGAQLAQPPLRIAQPEPPFEIGDLRDGDILSIPASIGKLEARTNDPNQRNLFAFGTPPPRPRPSSTPRPTPTPFAGPSPTPRPPREPPAPPWKCPLKLLGLGTHPAFPFAWFKDEQGAIYVARMGGVVNVMKDDEVEASCKLERVELDKVVLVNPENVRQEKTLSLDTKAN